MKKFFSPLILFSLLIGNLNAQNAEGDERKPAYRNKLLQRLAHANEDHGKVDLLFAIGQSYIFLYNDSAVYYGKEGLALSQKISYKPGEERCLWLLSFSMQLTGDFASALEFGAKDLSLAEELNDPLLITAGNFTLMSSYWAQHDYKEALKFGLKAELLSRSPKADAADRTRLLGMIASTYMELDQLDSALYYGLISYEMNKKIGLNWSGIYLHLGNVYAKKGLKDSAMAYYRKGLPIAEEAFLYIDLVDIYNQMSKIFESTGKMDSSVYYAQKSILQKGLQSYPEGQLNAANQLAHLYELTGERDSTIKYLKLSDELREKLYSREKTREMQSFAFNEQIHQEQLIAQKQQEQNKVKLYVLLTIIPVFLMVAFIQWRNNKQKQKANIVLELTLRNLKSTQAQLIQSEKMASLGELTAGIAHEIQNPLNFVNNFSEVNKEMIAELKEEINNGNYDEVKILANDIEANSEKINHHGRRADSIVKGMLQHSQSNSGIKEPSDINALADEYLRLSYHGLRAKEKSFNATMNAHFDEKIGKIDIVPQDIGRVFLNLFNNAFYAVNEKKRTQGESYNPVVSVTTKKNGDKVEIRLTDNGNGIPHKVIDKIFQPFFTTKPTGQGTGLGLSLSYDIIKAHGGEIKVDTKEGEFTEFMIQLPL